MAGLLEWSNSIRFAMANDPGRQIYQDQIQMHGFLYLNDYFDEIVAGTKHGYPISTSFYSALISMQYTH